MHQNKKTVFEPGFREALEEYSLPELARLRTDGLVDFDETQVTVTAEGWNFIRNVCRTFDLHLLSSRIPGEAGLYSRAV